MSAMEEAGLFVAHGTDHFFHPSPKGLPWFLMHCHRLIVEEIESEMWVCVQGWGMHRGSVPVAVEAAGGVGLRCSHKCSLSQLQGELLGWPCRAVLN